LQNDDRALGNARVGRGTHHYGDRPLALLRLKGDPLDVDAVRRFSGESLWREASQVTARKKEVAKTLFHGLFNGRRGCSTATGEHRQGKRN
jgi:hypothetical protein